VPGLRTNAAADLLGVSPNTLRSWERRFGYPSPRRSPGGHRQYELSDLEALRRALAETRDIAAAVQIAQQRGEGPGSAARLADAFESVDEAGADAIMEESIAVRSVERTVEELLLPALELMSERRGREAGVELACRWATGWLHSARRVVPPATRPEGVLLFDSSRGLDLESIHVQALELSLRRAGFRVLLLSVGLPQDRVGRALRALDPGAVVLCGSGASLDVVGRLVYAVRQGHDPASLYEYRDAMPVSGGHSVPSLGRLPIEATARLRELLQS
jgi:DNA-binding transcriptional MerR regulator